MRFNEGEGVQMRSKTLFLTLLLATAALGSMIIIGADAEPTAVIDEDNITYDKEEPKYSDTLTITAPVVLIDAELVSVNLEWKLCTETACNIPRKTNMTDNGDGTYSATIGGPFEEEDSGGDPYIDIGFTIEATYTPVGGGDEMMEESEEITVYFNRTSQSDDDDTGDDDDTADDDDDENGDDSPFGLEIIFAAVIITVGIMVFRKRK
jgi:hypothetical protein